MSRRLGVVWTCVVCWPTLAGAVDLSARYPPGENVRVNDSSAAKPWAFGREDVWMLRTWEFRVGQYLRIACGQSVLGIGHNEDGAVWAVVLPIDQAEVRHPQSRVPEPMAHAYLRFHPKRLSALFPADSVIGPAAAEYVPRIRAVAWMKFGSGYAREGCAVIPSPKSMVVDFDNTITMRRYYDVRLEPPGVRYRSHFTSRAVPRAAPVTEELASEVFEKLCSLFDREYPRFVVGATPDFAALRAEFGELARACRSDVEIAVVCAQMLSKLRDPQVALSRAGQRLPVFVPTPMLNINVIAASELLGSMINEPSGVRWTLTPEGIGYLFFREGLNADQYFQFVGGLKTVSAAKVLIVDLRLCAGDDPRAPSSVARHFVDQPCLYAMGQRRVGPRHVDFGEPEPQVIQPGGSGHYGGPVLVLIGPGCRGAGETLALMLAARDGVVTYGSPTFGAPGTAARVQLPASITCWIPQTLTLLPDGTTLDGSGLQPDVFIHAPPDAFRGSSDPVLEAALEAAVAHLPTSRPATRPKKTP